MVEVGGVTPVTQPTCSAGSWSVTGLNVSGVADGSVAVTADHSNSAGNPAIQATASVTKDTEGPTIVVVQAWTWSLSSPGNGVLSNDSDVDSALNVSGFVVNGQSYLAGEKRKTTRRFF